MNEKKRTGICPLIRELAARPEGVGLSEVPGFTGEEVSRNARNMEQRKKLIVVGLLRNRRLFLNQADADRYAAELPAIRAKAAAEKKERERERWRIKSKADRDAKRAAMPPKPPKPPKAVTGVSIPKYTGPKWDKNAPAIVPPHVVVQQIPSPKAFGPAAKLMGIGARREG